MNREQVQLANEVLKNMFAIEEMIIQKGLKSFFYYGNRKLRVKKFSIARALMMAYHSGKTITLMDRRNCAIILERKKESYRDLVVKDLATYKREV